MSSLTILNYDVIRPWNLPGDILIRSYTDSSSKPLLEDTSLVLLLILSSKTLLEDTSLHSFIDFVLKDPS